MNIDPAKLTEILQSVEKVSFALNVASPAPKDGWKTSEFYVNTVVGGLCAVFAPPPWNVLIPAILASVYTLARSLIKTAHAFGLAKNIPDPDIPQVPQALYPAPVVEGPVDPVKK